MVYLILKKGKIRERHHIIGYNCIFVLFCSLFITGKSYGFGQEKKFLMKNLAIGRTDKQGKFRSLEEKEKKGIKIPLTPAGQQIGSTIKQCYKVG